MMYVKYPKRASLLAALAALPLVAGAALGTSAAASPAPLTIAYITDVTGQAAAENGTSPAAFEARIDLQNAEGGVNGHKLVPLVIDDQTSPTEVITAVQDAISKGVIGIVSNSLLMFLAAKYPAAGGNTGDGRVYRWPGMGDPALHEHVRVGRRQCGSEVSGQHGDRCHPEGARRHCARRLRVRYFAHVHTGGRG